MNIILLDRVDGLGVLGDKVKVRSGYARNYLIPKGKATEATPTKIAAASLLPLTRQNHQLSHYRPNTW